MSVSSLFGIGSGPVTASPYTTTVKPTLSVNMPTASPSLDTARDRLRAASASLDAALDAFTNARPISPTTTVATSSIGGSVSGLTARIDPFDGGAAIMHTTIAVNTQTSTTRSSSSALQLNLTSSASRLFSSALRLDVTSPDTASILRSSARLGLDVTTPEAVSTLRSASGLGLDVTSPERASTLTSTGELSTATTTAYGPGTLDFSGSDSNGYLTGTYTGVGKAADATSLVITVTKGGKVDNHPSNNVEFEVRDQAGKLLFDFDGKLKAGQQVDLGDDIGLSIAFSAGQLAKYGRASTAITRTPVTVDGDARFNDSFTLRPQFDDKKRVTAGSFLVNNTRIKVEANDTLNTVLQRINASSASVTATRSGDRITLATQSNSEDPITLAEDTSGFLSAVKLKDAETVRGSVRDDEEVLAKTGQFFFLRSGSFTVNKVAITVDRNTDTLSSVLDRISQSEAGVTASYDASSDKVVLTSKAASEDAIEVERDSTGFLLATRLARPQSVSGAVQTALAALDAAQQSGGRDWQEAFEAIVNATFKTVAEPTVRGNVRDDLQVLAKTSMFGGVTSGSFTVNGVQIAVDRNIDSLSTVVSRINASGAGVIAEYDAAADGLVLTSRVNGAAAIAVGNDTTGLLAATGLSSSNTIRGHVAEDRVALSQLSSFASVTNGSFEVDGRTIVVDAATDTIRSITSKINESGARVVARYDATRDALVLQTTHDGEENMAIGRDTSGFLAAAGIDAAKTVKGNIRDDEQALAEVSPFSAVKSGAFQVNGVTIAVDAAKDSLQTVLDRINRAGAGVTATYQSTTGRVTFTPTVGTLSLENDTSGFLKAVAVATGTTTARANANGAFNGTGVDGAGLDPNAQVTAGRFTVNGVAIAVEANDSINAVLRKITSSKAGVAAVYDEASQTMTLAAQGGAKGEVVLGDDTSGFIAAMKLDRGVTRGRQSISAFDATLDQMAEYAGVRAGVVTVNGKTIEIDPAKTTVRSLVSALNGIDDVAARLSESTGKVTLSSRLGAGTLAISDSSGLLSALGIAAGTYDATPGGTKVVQVKTAPSTEPRSSARVEAAVRELNAVVSDISRNSRTATELRDEIKSALAESVGALREAGIKGLRLPDVPGGTNESSSRASGTAAAPGDTLLATTLDSLMKKAAALDEVKPAAAQPAPAPNLPAGDMTPAPVAASQSVQSTLPPHAALRMQEADRAGRKAAELPENAPTPLAKSERLAVAMSQLKEQMTVQQARIVPKTRATEVFTPAPGPTPSTSSVSKPGAAKEPARPTPLDRLRRGGVKDLKEDPLDPSSSTSESVPEIPADGSPRLGGPDDPLTVRRRLAASGRAARRADDWTRLGIRRRA